MINLIKNHLLFKFLLRSAALLFVSIACIEILTYQKTGKIIEAQINEQQKREVANFAGNIERQIEQLAIDSKIIARLPAIEDMLINTRYGLIAEAKRMLPQIEKFLAIQSQRNKNYQQFGICDRKGKLQFLYPTSSKPLSSIRCSEQPSIVLVNHGAQSLLLSQTPIMRDQQFIGSAFVLLNISDIFNKISSEHIFDTGFLALFDKSRLLLTRVETKNQDFAERLIQVQLPTDGALNQSFDNKETFIYTQPIPSMQWRLYAVVYADEMFAELVNILYLISFVVLCVFVVEVVFLSYFTNALVLKPINELLQATKHILKGNFNHNIAVKSSDEIGKLTHSFNQMTQTVDKQMAELTDLNREFKLIYSIFESGKEGVIVADSQWQVIDVNRAFINHFSFSKADLLDTCALELLGQHQQIVDAITDNVENQGYWHGEILLYAKSGKEFAQLCSVNRVMDDNYQTTHYILLFSDITQLKETQKKLEKLAHYDELTGLYNRYQFNISLHLAIEEAQGSDSGFALFFIDLDNFKYINDTMGHDIGDGFLQEVAARLKQATRTSDIVSRFGGDEFVLLLKNLRNQNNITVLADKVREVLNSKFEIQNKQIYASASIGIAAYPQDAQTPADLLKAADIAMYSAKDSGKNAYQFYMPQMNQAIAEKLNFEEHLTKALKLDEFEFFYQAKVNIDNPNTISAEALIRWRKDGKQLVGPNEFIAIAEESGIIVPISYQVFDKGCRFIKSLNEQFQKPVSLSFNLSGRQFRQHDLAQQLYQIAQQHQIDPGNIEFEITESVIMADPQLAKDICQQIKRFGFKLSLDDFGTGYSSLSYIRDYPLDCIKVDRSFVTDIESSITNQAIINAVLSIADSLSLDILCEGVETKSQLDFLTKMGINQFQGYYFSKPLAADDFMQYLADNTAVAEQE